MGKKERKGRLDKGSAGKAEFIGFGAFATNATASTATNDSNNNETTKSTSASSPTTTLQWSPVYTGSDSSSQMNLIFKKISQKRDSVTKARALQEELQPYFASPQKEKRHQISALVHFMFLFHTKLNYDSSPLVRAASFQCLAAAYQRIPKAFQNICDGHPELYGMMWCGRNDVTSSDVRLAAQQLSFFGDHRPAEGSSSGTTASEAAKEKDNNSSTPMMVQGLAQYVSRMLGYKRAKTLHEALFVRKNNNNSTSTTSNAKSGLDKKQSKSSSSSSQSQQVQLSESEKEEAEERFERVIGCALTGIEEWVQTYGWNDELLVFENGLLWKTLAATKSSFRRKTYAMISALCQRAPILVYGTEEELVSSPSTVSLSKQLISSLSQEKEPTNIPPLLEVLLLYLASFPAVTLSCSSTKWYEVLDASMICKSLQKILRKACLGASAYRWGPTMLPLLAQMPIDLVATHHKDGKRQQQPPPQQKQDAEAQDSVLLFSLPLALLSSMWDGREVALGSGDTFAIVAAVAECASFLLIRKLPPLLSSSSNSARCSGDTTCHSRYDTDSSDEEHNINPLAIAAQDIASYLIKAIEFYLTKSTMASPSAPAAGQQRAEKMLADGLARDLYKLEQYSALHQQQQNDQTKRKCALLPIKSWFWQEGIKYAILGSSSSSSSSFSTPTAIYDNSKLSELVIDLQHRLGLEEKETNDSAKSHFVPIFRHKFLSLVEKYHTKSERVPKKSDYDIMIACLNFCGVANIFKVDTATTKLDESQCDNNNNGINDDDLLDMKVFLMNDLLRWIVTHSSSLTAPGRLGSRDGLLRRDFELLRICLLGTTSLSSSSLLSFRQSMWRSILQEMVAAKCDLELFVTAITELLSGSAKDNTTQNLSRAEWAAILKCDKMDEFAIQAGADALLEFRNHSQQILTVAASLGDESDDADTGSEYEFDMDKTALFLHTCVGLASGASTVLVDDRVVHEWIGIACNKENRSAIDKHQHPGDEDIPNPLLATLLALAQHGSTSLNQKHIAQVILESWREGGPLWYGASLNLLLGDIASDVENDVKQTECRSALCQQIIAEASKECAHFLREVCALRSVGRKGVSSACHSWAERAWRLLQLCEEARKIKGGKDEYPNSSLSLVGLADLDLWQDSILGQQVVVANNLHLSLIFLLQHVDNLSSRLELMLGSSDDNVHLEVLILLSFSSCSFLQKGANRTTRLLALLGERGGIPRPRVLSWCHEIIQILSSDMQSDGEENAGRINGGVSLLSTLVGHLFDRIDRKGGVSDEVSASEVKEDEILWYVVNKEDENKREHVKIVKIHRDDFPRLYFSIQPLTDNEDGSAQRERQTVAERLRRNQTPTPNQTDDKNLLERQKIEELIFTKLVRPVIEAQEAKKNEIAFHAAGECLNIIISQCGLQGKAGLGSIRYEVFQSITLLNRTLVEGLSGERKEARLEATLTCLTSSMGLGILTENSSDNFDVIRYSPEDSINALLRYYEDATITARGGMDRAVLKWLACAVHAVNDDIIKESVSLLIKLTIRLVGSHSNDYGLLLDDSLLAMEILYGIDDKLCHVDLVGNQNFTQDQIDLYSALIELFALKWKNEVRGGDIFEALGENEERPLSRPVWHMPFCRLLQTGLARDPKMVASAANRNSDSLTKALFVPNKKWAALKLIVAIAKSNETINDGDSDELNQETQSLLESWQEHLHEEEAIELEADVYATFNWLPKDLMRMLECWNEDEATSINEQNSIGRMLCWLCFLEFLDSAAAADSTNRSAFSSYIKNCGSVQHILSLALSYAGIENDRATSLSIIDIKELMKDEDSLEVSKVATVVLFRTVEVLPTLSKNWWTNDCPRIQSTAVSKFVQNKVAPETLKRELERIKNATEFGDMSVSGSCVSREITATYMQDECQLSFAIQIPPIFPLRNVDVDGKKTLGIPEKRWKRWALQIQLMLNSQDGTLLDALMLWKENVDKEFEGVEPCPICYSVLAVKTHELPNLECKTCCNRFHSNCLHKWFQNSGKNQCVLCQQPWSGTRIN